MKASYFLEDFDMQDLKDNEANTSPKSAHHAMGLEAAEYPTELEPNSPNKEDYGQTEEEQRKGLWRSIFGYFRGPKKGAKVPGVQTKSAKDAQSAAPEK